MEPPRLRREAKRSAMSPAPIHSADRGEREERESRLGFERFLIQSSASLSQNTPSYHEEARPFPSWASWCEANRLRSSLTIAPGPLPLAPPPSRRAWCTAGRDPTVLETARACSRVERPLGRRGGHTARNHGKDTTKLTCKPWEFGHLLEVLLQLRSRAALRPVQLCQLGLRGRLLQLRGHDAEEVAQIAQAKVAVLLRRGGAGAAHALARQAALEDLRRGLRTERELRRSKAAGGALPSPLGRACLRYILSSTVPQDMRRYTTTSLVWPIL